MRKEGLEEIRRGDIYYIAGGVFTGSEMRAERPAVIVSNDKANEHGPIVEIVYLTTRQKPKLPTHVLINSTRRQSTALCEQVDTADKSRLGTYLDRVTEAELQQIDEALTVSLGIEKAGGKAVMKITMVTPYGEMNFEMSQEKVSDIIQRAMQYAAEKTEEEKATEMPPVMPDIAEKRPETTQPRISQHRRIDSLFGQQVRQSTAQKKTEEQEETGEPEEYRGFLLIKCRDCGEVKGFCAKNAITTHTCKCGAETPLHGLKPAFVNCKCGGRFKYKTNITDERIEYNCIQCGSPVDLELNGRRNTYVTVE